MAAASRRGRQASTAAAMASGGAQRRGGRRSSCPTRTASMAAAAATTAAKSPPPSQKTSTTARRQDRRGQHPMPQVGFQSKRLSRLRGRHRRLLRRSAARAAWNSSSGRLQLVRPIVGPQHVLEHQFGVGGLPRGGSWSSRCSPEVRTIRSTRRAGRGGEVARSNASSSRLSGAALPARHVGGVAAGGVDDVGPRRHS